MEALIHPISLQVDLVDLMGGKALAGDSAVRVLARKLYGAIADGRKSDAGKFLETPGLQQGHAEALEAYGLENITRHKEVLSLETIAFESYVKEMGFRM